MNSDKVTLELDVKDFFMLVHICGAHNSHGYMKQVQPYINYSQSTSVGTGGFINSNNEITAVEQDKLRREFYNNGVRFIKNEMKDYWHGG